MDIQECIESLVLALRNKLTTSNDMKRAIVVSEAIRMIEGEMGVLCDLSLPDTILKEPEFY